MTSYRKALLIGAALFGLLLNIPSSAVHDVDEFELDNPVGVGTSDPSGGGNAIDQSTVSDPDSDSPPDDWGQDDNGPNCADPVDGSCGYVTGPDVDPSNPGGDANLSIFVLDPNGEDTDADGDPIDPVYNTAGGGSKDDIDVSQWRWHFQSANDKTDLLPVGAAHYTDASGDDILYWHGSLFAPNGSAAIGIWLLSKDICLGGDGVGADPFVVDTNDNGICDTGETTAAGHKVGDLALQVDYIGTTSDPSVVSIRALRWIGGLTNTQKTTTCTAFGGTVVGQNLTNATLCLVSETVEGQSDLCDTPELADDYACATTNFEDTESPDDWGYLAKDSTQPDTGPASPAGTEGIDNEDFPARTFFEGGVNLTNFGISGCFGTFLMNTRTSHSLSAVLEDFAFGDFDLCGISVTKTGTTLTKVGDDASYTITVTNTGLVTLYKQSIVDTLLGNLTDGTNPLIDNSTCGASLAPGASCTITATRTVLGGDPDPLPNTVTVIYDSESNLTGDESTSSDDHEVNLFQPEIEIVKTGPTTAEVGQQITYNFTINNNSSADSPDLNLVSVTDTGDNNGGAGLGNLTAAAAAVNPSCSTLASGDSCNFSVNYTVLAGDDDPLDNTVEAFYEPTGFPNDIKDTDPHSVNIVVPNVEIVKTGDELSKVGDQVTYSFTITNTGETSLVLDTLVDDVLGDLEDDAPASCDNLAVGGSCNFQVNYTIQSADPDPLVNTVEVHYDSAGGFDVNDDDTHSVELFQPSVKVTKDGPATGEVGEEITYSFEIENTSSNDSPNLVVVSISDDVLGNLLDDAPAACDELAPGAKCNFTAKYTILVTDTDPLVNKVTVHYNPDGFPNDITDDDDHTLDILLPGVEIIKTGDELSKIGDKVDYHFEINNTGQTVLTLDSILDDKIGNIETAATNAGCGTLQPDDNVDGSGADECDFDVLQFTIPGGATDPFINKVTVVYDSAGGNSVNDDDTHSINLFQPSIDVEKVCTNEPVIVGDNAIFSITITNTSSTDTPNLIKDTISDGTPPVGCDDLAFGENCQFNVSILATQADLVGGITNSVTVNYNPNGFPNDIGDTDSDNCDVVPPAPATIIIEKELRPGTGTFNYTTTTGAGGSGLADFDLTPLVGAPTLGSALGPVLNPATDGFDSTGDIQVGTVFGQEVTYTVEETGLATGTAFASLSCTGTANTSVLGDVATIKVEPGETATCRFINTGAVFEGCTPGYWRNHPNRWNGVGDLNDCGFSDADDFTDDIKTCDAFNTRLGVTDTESGLTNGTTLLQGTKLRGGGKTALNRHVSAGLASADSGINYEFSVQDLIDLYQDAVNAVPGPETVSSALAKISAANEAGCPLN